MHEPRVGDGKGISSNSTSISSRIGTILAGFRLSVRKNIYVCRRYCNNPHFIQMSCEKCLVIRLSEGNLPNSGSRAIIIFASDKNYWLT